MKKLFLICLCVCGCCAALRAESAGEILTFPANPEKGFHWGYVLYLPKTMDTSKKLPILFEMNNEDVYESAAELETAVKEDVRTNGIYYNFADKLGVPLLVPLLLQEKEPFHTRQLNRAVFKRQEGPWARLEDQALAMVQDARWQLKQHHIRTQKKFLVAGFSTPGAFAWRLMALHPRHIIAGVVGGQPYLTMPLETYHNTPLIYPVGVYDFTQYGRKPFDKKAWLKIPILAVNGGDDYNDSLPYDHVYSDEERSVFMQVHGKENLQQRWRSVQEVLAQYAPNVQTHTYPNLGHEAVWDDCIAFLKKHITGGPLRPVAMTDTSGRPALLPIQVTALYFGQEAPVTHDREHLRDTDLLLQTDKKSPFWMIYRSSCLLDIYAGQTAVLTELECQGRFSGPPSFLQIHLTDEQVAKLKSYKNGVFTVYSHYPYIVEIPENLTFTVK